MADRDLQHADLLHADEPRVEVPRARQQDLLLQAATAAAFHKRLRVLEVIMGRHELARDFTRIDGSAIERRDNPDSVRLHRVDM